jgi:putative ABC transport system permease protein
LDYLALDTVDLALGGVLILLAAGLSMALQLGLQWKLLIAAARMIAQLLLVGLVLKTLFALTSPLWTMLAALFMIAFAGREVMARQEGGLPRLWSYGIGSAAMLTAAGLVTVLALTTQVRPDPWYDPRYAIPLLGMILGNCLTGISLGLQSLTRGARQQRDGIEAQLALGAERMTALLPVLREALRTALMPIINAMSATGLVALPGMMTGQILAGADPVEAVKYQLLIMFLIAGGTSLGAIMAVLSGLYRITDHRHRLRLDRLIEGED